MGNPFTQQMKDDVLRQLSIELSAGVNHGLEDCLELMARFHRYRWENVLLIHHQRPYATRLATIPAWNQLGRIVRSDANGIVLEWPVETCRSTDPVAKQLAKDGTLEVFDIAQTDGKPVAPGAVVSHRAETLAKTLSAIARSDGVTLLVDDGPPKAIGLVTSRHEVALSPHMTSEDVCVRYAHQIAHQLLHRDLSDPTLHDAVIEAEADATALVVSRALGLATTALSDVVALYKDGTAALCDSLEAIQRASAHIVDHVLMRERTERNLPDVHRNPPAPNQDDSMSWDR